MFVKETWQGWSCDQQEFPDQKVRKQCKLIGSPRMLVTVNRVAKLFMKFYSNGSQKINHFSPNDAST